MRKLPTGEPCAGEPHARFGGRGRREPFPTPISSCLDPAVTGLDARFRGHDTSVHALSSLTGVFGGEYEGGRNRKGRG